MGNYNCFMCKTSLDDETKLCYICNDKDCETPVLPLKDDCYSFVIEYLDKYDTSLPTRKVERKRIEYTRLYLCKECCKDLMSEIKKIYGYKFEV